MGLQDYHNTGDSSQGLLSGVSTWHAQNFTAGSSYTIGSLKIKVFIDVGATGTMTVSIRATSAGKPTGGDLTSGSLDISGFDTSAPGSFKEFTLTPYALSSGTVYAIVVRDDTANNSYWRVSTGNQYAGEAYISSNSGSSWSVWGSGLDFMFETYTPSVSYVELAGTIAGVSSIPTADLAVITVKELKGTIAGVSNIPSAPLGSVSVNLGNSGIVAYKRLIAVGNNELWYEDL